MTAISRLSPRTYWALCLACVALTAGILRLLGRSFICTSGSVKLWIGDIHSNELSQHLTDWYTFTHVLHGVLYYFAGWIISRRCKLPLGMWVLLTVVGASAWEVLENTNFIIDHYRTRTMSKGYYGDSVINAVSDILAAVFGLYLTSIMRWQYAVIFYIAVELMLIICIRDSLTINIIMLIFPIKAIKDWQFSV